MRVVTCARSYTLERMGEGVSEREGERQGERVRDRDRVRERDREREGNEELQCQVSLYLGGIMNSPQHTHTHTHTINSYTAAS